MMMALMTQTQEIIKPHYGTMSTLKEFLIGFLPTHKVHITGSIILVVLVGVILLTSKQIFKIYINNSTSRQLVRLQQIYPVIQLGWNKNSAKWCTKQCSKPCKTASMENLELLIPTVAGYTHQTDILVEPSQFVDQYEIVYQVEYFPFVSNSRIFVATVDYKIITKTEINLNLIPWIIDSDLNVEESVLVVGEEETLPLYQRSHNDRVYFDGFNNKSSTFLVRLTFAGPIYEYNAANLRKGFIYRQLRKNNINSKLPIEYIITCEIFPDGVTKILPIFERITWHPHQLIIQVKYSENEVVGFPLIISDVTIVADQHRRIAKYTYYGTRFEYVLFFVGTLQKCDTEKQFNIKTFVPYGESCLYKYADVQSKVNSIINSTYSPKFQRTPHYLTVVHLHEEHDVIDQFPSHEHIVFLPYMVNIVNNLTSVSLQQHFNVYHMFVKYRLSFLKRNVLLLGPSWRFRWIYDCVVRFISLEIFNAFNNKGFSVDFYFRDRVFKGDLWGDHFYGRIPAIVDVIDTPHVNDLLRWKIFLIASQFLKANAIITSTNHTDDGDSFSSVILELLLEQIKQFEENRDEIVRQEDYVAHLVETFFDVSVEALWTWFSFRGCLILRVDFPPGQVLITPQIHCRYHKTFRPCQNQPNILMLTLFYRSSKNVTTVYNREVTLNSQNKALIRPFHLDGRLYVRPIPYAVLLPESYYRIDALKANLIYDKIRLYADVIFTIQEGYHGPFEANYYRDARRMCYFLGKKLVTHLRDKPHYFQAMNFFIYCAVESYYKDFMQGIFLYKV